MSVDLGLIRVPEGFNGMLEDLPSDWGLKNICTRKYLIAELEKLFPKVYNAKVENAGSLLVREEKYSLEFSIGNDSIISYITVYIRAEDLELALKTVKHFCEILNCKAIDIQGSDFLDFN